MDDAVSIVAEYVGLQVPLVEACKRVYGDRLVSLVVFGSAGRGTPGPDSDVDLLLIVDPLPHGRIRRVEEFDAVEELMTSCVDRLWRKGMHVRLSPLFKTPDEIRLGSPLLLDMTEDARVLHDRDGFFGREIQQLRHRLQRLGARRIWHGSAWYWDLKPDYRPGDVFEI